MGLVLVSTAEDIAVEPTIRIFSHKPEEGEREGGEGRGGREGGKEGGREGVRELKYLVKPSIYYMYIQ